MEYNSPPFKENERLSRLAIKYNNRENTKTKLETMEEDKSLYQ